MEKSSEIIDTNDTESLAKGRQYGKWTNILWEVLMPLLTVLVSIAASSMYQKTTIQMAGIGIITAAGAGSVLFSLERSREEGSFLFDNEEHLWRFMVIYLIALLGSILFPMLPAGGWPYLVIFVGLMLFSNQIIGLSAGSVLLMVSVMIQGSDVSTFFVYFISGLVGITVFSYVDKTFKI